MSVRIALDSPSTFYTNLDFVSGRIILVLTSDEDVSAITVKLEGESKTMLLRPTQYNHHRRRQEPNRVAYEYHKILYKTHQVFPPQGPTLGKLSGLTYTLPAGQHQYSFRFKIPFSNSCASQTQGINVPFAGFIPFPALLYHHKNTTLPPSLTGFPNEAEIRYYVKVTVKRPSVLKESRRSQVGFKFLPIEPPRSPPSAAEAYARRSHAFTVSSLASFPSSKGPFTRSPMPLSGTPPSVLVDARLPLLTCEQISILTCNEPVPLRVFVKKQIESPQHVFLVSLLITLTGFTEVRAHEVSRTEISTWIVTNQHGLSIPISNPTDPVGKEIVLDSNLWDRIPLPPTVTPSFDTCNLTRSYALEVTLIIGYGFPGQIHPQVQSLPLRLQARVYSGIAPPTALLEAIASRPRPGVPARPSDTSTPPRFDPLYPPQLGTPGAPQASDLPPSYEDAIAENIGPLDGPRGNWSGITNENAPSDVGDGKGQGMPTREGSKIMR